MVALSSTSSSNRKRDFYEHFLENTGRDHFQSQAVNISYEDFYERGFFILAWDRTPSANNRFTRHEMDHGSLSLNLKHEGVTDHTYNVLMYTSYSDAFKFNGTEVNSNYLTL